MDKDLMLYTLHRFAVYAAGRRVPFNQLALETALQNSGIESFSALVDLDEDARDALGRVVLKHLRLDAPFPVGARRGAALKMSQSAR